MWGNSNLVNVAVGVNCAWNVWANGSRTWESLGKGVNCAGPSLSDDVLTLWVTVTVNVVWSVVFEGSLFFSTVGSCN